MVEIKRINTAFDAVSDDDEIIQVVYTFTARQLRQAFDAEQSINKEFTSFSPAACRKILDAAETVDVTECGGIECFGNTAGHYTEWSCKGIDLIRDTPPYQMAILHKLADLVVVRANDLNENRSHYKSYIQTGEVWRQTVVREALQVADQGLNAAKKKIVSLLGGSGGLKASQIPKDYISIGGIDPAIINDDGRPVAYLSSADLELLYFVAPEEVKPRIIKFLKSNVRGYCGIPTEAPE